MPERARRDQIGPPSAMRAIAAVLSFVAPPRCGICGGPCGVAHPACDRCVAALARAPATQRRVAGLDEVWSALAYEREARELITALKFRRLAPLARLAAKVMAAKAPENLLAPTATRQRGHGFDPVIVPVPPSPARLRSRGLDPAEEIAKALGVLTGLRVEPVLGRDDAARQAGRARRERLEDPPRFFVVGEPPTSALLVDDVLTTGATLGACASVLRRAGSARAVGMTFACAERQPLGQVVGKRRVGG